MTTKPAERRARFSIDPEIERRQIERVRAVRAGRSRRRVADGARARSSRRRATASNLVPPIIAAVEARATLGEIADALRRVFGEYQDDRRVMAAPLLDVQHLTVRLRRARGRA